VYTHPIATLLARPPADRRLELPGTAADPEIEVLFPAPQDVRGALDPQRIVDPVHERLRPAAAELRLELVLEDVAAALPGVLPPPFPSASDRPPQGLGEGLGAGRIVGVVSLEEEIRHQVDGDHRFPGAGPPSDDEHRLPAAVEALPREREYLVIDDELFIEEDVLGLPPDHSAHVLHELLAGAVPVLLDSLEYPEPVARLDVPFQESGELIEVIGCEGRAVFESPRELLGKKNITGLMVMIVQVGASVQRDGTRRRIKSRVDVQEILAVLSHLD
jgi:hypothetical protein